MFPNILILPKNNVFFAQESRSLILIKISVWTVLPKVHTSTGDSAQHALQENSSMRQAKIASPALLIKYITHSQNSVNAHMVPFGMEIYALRVIILNTSILKQRSVRIAHTARFMIY